MSAAEMHRELAEVYRRHGQERFARAHDQLAEQFDAAKEDA